MKPTEQMQVAYRLSVRTRREKLADCYAMFRVSLARLMRGERPMFRHYLFH